jgi:hypothetical protein
MRIVVLSDTHVDRLEHLPEKIADAISSADLIIHAGDFTDVQVLKELRQLRQVKAVHGNTGSQELETVLAAKEIVEVTNKRIGITHGSGAPCGIEERVRKMLESDQIDIIVYGHPHQAQSKVIKGIPFLNPGKADESFGILDINAEARGGIVSSR